MAYLDSDTLPIRVHYDREDYLEQAEAVLAAVELSWQVQVEEMGFRAPIISDDDEGLFPVYLSGPPEVYSWEAWVAGTGWPDVDLEEGDGYNGTSSYMVLHRDLSDPWLDSYVAHEFQHATQFATDFSEPTYPIWEAVATAAQDWTLGEAGLWYVDSVESFQELPWAPVLVGDANTVMTGDLGYYYEYGAALWIMHLDEVLGSGDGQAGVELWQGCANEGDVNEPDAVDSFVAMAGGLGEGLNAIARTRWLVGDEWDDRGLADAADWDEGFVVPTEAEWTTADLPAQTSFTKGPMITGQGFVPLDLADAGDQRLQVTVSSEDGLSSALLVLWWGEDGSVGEESDVGTAPTVSLDTAGISRVVIAVTNLGTDAWDGDDNPYRAGDQLLSAELVEASDTDASDTDTDDTDAGGEGCGCSGAGGSGLVLLFVPLWLRRRR